MSERPRIERDMHTATSVVSDEARAWAADLLERNRRALEALDVAAGRHRGSCAQCGSEGLLYHEEPNDAGSRLICPRCSRAAAVGVVRVQLCDNNPEHGQAWRNPYTRRNEYLCAGCHAGSGDGVIQNRWARVVDDVSPRYSIPLSGVKRAVCAAANVPGTKPCRGEIKPRGATGVELCNQHAGKQSAADEYFNS